MQLAERNYAHLQQRANGVLTDEHTRRQHPAVSRRFEAVGRMGYWKSSLKSSACCTVSRGKALQPQHRIGIISRKRARVYHIHMQWSLLGSRSEAEFLGSRAESPLLLTACRNRKDRLPAIYMPAEDFSWKVPRDCHI